jgi:hypothetical protein
VRVYVRRFGGVSACVCLLLCVHARVCELSVCECVREGGRYCGLEVFLCRNAFQNLFRLLRIHRPRTLLDCFGHLKAPLMEPANKWNTAIGMHFKNFDAPGSLCDSLHGNSHEEPELRGHARVGWGLTRLGAGQPGWPHWRPWSHST